MSKAKLEPKIPGSQNCPLKEITINPYDAMTMDQDSFLGVEVKHSYVPLSQPKNKAGVCPNEGFFWFYPSHNPDAPVLCTVIGGPGMCCISKAFGRYNPLDIDPKTRKFVKNDDSIIDRFSLLYLECPVGSGFSIATKETMVSTYAHLGENAMECIEYVMESHPQARETKWFFNGESFCGLSVPQIACHFIDAYPGLYKGAVLETCVLSPKQTQGYDYQLAILDEHKIWNGCCHRCYCSYCMCMGLCCWKMGCMDFSSFENCWFMPFMWPFGKFSKVEAEWDDDSECYVKKTRFRYAPTNLSHHDACTDALECRTEIAWMIKSKPFQKLIGSKKVVNAIADGEFVHIMEKDENHCSDVNLNKMLAVPDSSVLVMTGSGDLIVPSPGVEA
jgi:hypothetical protein